MSSGLSQQVSSHQRCAADGQKAQKGSQFSGKERRFARGNTELVRDPFQDWPQVKSADNDDAKQRQAEDRNRPLRAAGIRPYRQPYQAGTHGGHGGPEEDVSDDEAGDGNPAEATDDDAHKGAPESRCPPDS